ncbi:hypothetical protein DFQ05_0766 [Winogradskyella wandonensis]|uniref:DUF4136 domain-containing protein n=1 Tax=Winogradskyella wandonensis TaxID=1442586 RepID=A0A4R1KVM9_9FLAO|nr:hypothetical protein [Winogradskyella wandonensis]TCK69246.1 hypothetical protein DFQ05_0766 [Winogradskyella wandonensis]
MKKNFKILLLLLAFSSVVANSFAQTNNSELKELSDKMFQYTNDRDFDALLDMTYPKIFELVPKETMKTVFVSMFQGTEEMSVDLPKQNPEYVLSDIYKTENDSTDFAFLSYDMFMSMTFKKQEFDDEGKDMMIKMMKLQGMEASFENNSKVNVKAPNRLVIFIKNEDTKDEWKMLNYDPNSPIFADLLPVDVLEKSMDYYQKLQLESKKKN